MRGARPQRQLEEQIARAGVVRRGERLLIACSAGPDSVALAGALASLAAPMRLSLRLAYVDHRTRASAAQDECVVASLAAAFGLPYDIARLEARGGGEAPLREARYAALAQLARRSERTVVATAHHAEDQSETVLLALFRGSGPGGIGGMRSRRELAAGIELVRPLLRTSAQELRAYCHLRGLPYAVDPTNDEIRLRRNAVRTALEALRPLFGGLDEAIARAAELCADEREARPRAGLRRRVRDRLAMERELRDVDFEHVEAAVRALETGSSGSFFMKDGLRLEIRGGEIAGITRT